MRSGDFQAKAMATGDLFRRQPWPEMLLSPPGRFFYNKPLRLRAESNEAPADEHTNLLSSSEPRACGPQAHTVLNIIPTGQGVRHGRTAGARGKEMNTIDDFPQT